MPLATTRFNRFERVSALLLFVHCVCVYVSVYAEQAAPTFTAPDPADG